jgi:hypothetical protein
MALEPRPNGGGWRLFPGVGKICPVSCRDGNLLCELTTGTLADKPFTAVESTTMARQNNRLATQLSKRRTRGQSAKMRRLKRNARCPRVERLEDRQLMAANISMMGSSLIIQADSSGGEVTITEESTPPVYLPGLYGGTGKCIPGFRYLVVDGRSNGGNIRQTIDATAVERIFFLGTMNNDQFYNRTAVESYQYGYGGHDILSGGSATDRLYGGSGNDRLYGNAGDDHIEGGADNDYLYGDTRAVYSHDGSNLRDVQAYQQGGNDTLFGDGGNDYVHGGGGNDEIEGGDGNDHLYGNHGNDKIRGDSGYDYLFGQLGDDHLEGGVGDDCLYGQDGKDILLGGAGGDWLYGGEGDDYLLGGTDNDKLFGGGGSDFLFGDDGSDFLDAGSASETALGGRGQDMHAYAWSTNGTFYTEAIQGASDTCWIVASLAAVTMQGTDLTDRISYMGNGVYRVSLFQFEDPTNRETSSLRSHTEYVRFTGDRLAEDAAITGDSGNLTSDGTADFWALLMQRAVLQAVSRWDATQSVETPHSGGPLDALRMITGKSGQRITELRTSAATVNSSLKAGKAVVLTTSPTASSRIGQLDNSHVYIVLGMVYHPDPTVGTVTLLDPRGNSSPFTLCWNAVVNGSTAVDMV